MHSSQKPIISEQVNQPTSLSIQKLNDLFNFDWNDHRTFESNKTKVAELEKILPSLDTLNEGDKYAFGQLCLKLGTFYSHIQRAPALALEKLLIAEAILTGNELAWTKNHIAFSFQQMLVMNKKEKNAEEIGKNMASAMEGSKFIIENFSMIEKGEAIKIIAFAYCVKALVEYEAGHLSAAVKSYRSALDLYEKYSLLDDQYARAKNRYAQFLVEQKNDHEAFRAFKELEIYWSSKHDQCNPYPARFYASYAAYLSVTSSDNLMLALEKYKKAYDILRMTDGEQSQIAKEIGQKILDTQTTINKHAFDAALGGVVQQLTTLPFNAREVFIESFATLLLRGFVPMSGMTVQQHISADSLQLEQLNTLTNKKDGYQNGTDARYVYQFAREATSGGVVPVFRNKVTGELYMALICNKRTLNLDMYNWSAGYTEAPLPSWRGKLHSATERDIYYNRANIKESATNTMKKALEAADGDWSKVSYDHKQFEAGFQADGVLLPTIDINSLHTASRECLEEMNLDLAQFPQRQTFLISHDNTVGISQGDAPGQTSNRSHQYMVYLGELDKPPVIQPGDDVAIADWIRVSSIQRNNAMDYTAHGKSLCIYMLRGIELGLQTLWHFLLQQASTQVSRYSGKAITRFSSPDNVVAEIEHYCDKHNIHLAGTKIVYFLRSISGELPSKTYTGQPAQAILNGLLETVTYLMSPRLQPESFLKEMNKIVSSIDRATSLNMAQTVINDVQPSQEKQASALVAASMFTASEQPSPVFSDVPASAPMKNRCTSTG